MRLTALLTVPLAVGALLGVAASPAPAAVHAPVRAGAAGVADVTLTDADNGRTLTVQSGTDLRVRLTGSRSPDATWAWSLPTADDTEVADRTTALTSQNGNAMADFRTQQPGTTGIEAYKRCIPEPGRACPHLVVLWKVTVMVQDGPGRTAEQLSLPELVERATDRVRAAHPQAVLMLAAGDSPGGPVRDMDRVTHWRFVFNNRDNSSEEISGSLDGTLGPVTPHTGRWMGVLAIGELPAMTPDQAYDRLEAAGHGDAYRYVSLVKPMGTPPWHLQYHFSQHPGGCDGYAVFTGTGEVSPICGS
ncbi:hypothetical protein ACFY2W_02540 [Streptomyces sp. NPDC001262]|uniref:hypothetical protein n=1 Tax=Streptomyces sp. NPDC001262 TaxID=3364552 RepID=UPI0036C8D9B5